MRSDQLPKTRACLNRWLLDVLFLIIILLILVVIIIILIITTHNLKKKKRVNRKQKKQNSTGETTLTRLRRLHPLPGPFSFFSEMKTSVKCLQSLGRPKELKGCKSNLWFWSWWSSGSFLWRFNIFLLFFLLFFIILVEGLIGLHHCTSWEMCQTGFRYRYCGNSFGDTHWRGAGHLCELDQNLLLDGRLLEVWWWTHPGKPTTHTKVSYTPWQPDQNQTKCP